MENRLKTVRRLAQSVTRSLLGLAMVALLSACVTVNIYFPAAAAQKLADQVVEQVYRAAEKGKVEVHEKGTAPAAPATPSASGRSAAAPAPSAWLRPSPAAPWWERGAGALANTVFTSFSGTARAAADLNASSPGVVAARAELESLAAQMQPYFVSGAVGYTNAGLVAVHDADAVSLAQRAALPGLVASYNRALENLYQQIADANGHPEWKAQIQETFAQAWIRKAPPGYWYQTAGGAWQRK